MSKRKLLWNVIESDDKRFYVNKQFLGTSMISLIMVIAGMDSISDHGITWSGLTLLIMGIIMIGYLIGWNVRDTNGTE